MTCIHDDKTVSESLRSPTLPEDFFRRWFSSLPKPVMIFEEKSMAVIDVNDAALKLYGYSREEMLNLTALDISIEGDATRRCFRQTVAGDLDEIPFRYHKKKDGTVFPVEVIPTAIPYQNRTIVCGLVKDISERMKMEDIRFRSSILKTSRFGDIIGQSQAMLDVYATLLKASMSDVSVILYGESGTGKELAARAIHDLSDRKDKPFITVNCGAIPQDLIESEFFGHRKGAFTGAFADKMGYLDCADGGTLFLDEIGDISQNMQVKLLRALDEGGYTPIGGKDIKRPDLRIISATNKDLRQKIRQGLFREDFFYRIHILSIQMPPLRKREGDVGLLARHFLHHFTHGDSIAIPAHVLKAMETHSWPGNVRELKNVVQRFVALANKTPEGQMIPLLELSDNTDSGVSESSPLPQKTQALNGVLEQHEMDHIRQVLEKEHWHQGNAAGVLGIHPKTLARKMRRFGLA